MRASVIISTYNQPGWLKKALFGYEQQRSSEFEIIVADDGSGPDTAAVVSSWRRSDVAIRHVWHPDEGFRKNVILNRAVLASTHPYLIFTDGDCIPRADFVSTHLSLASRGRFLSGGAYRLTMKVSHEITLEDILDDKCFSISWLKEKGEPPNVHLLKLIRFPPAALFLNRVVRPFTRTTFNGNNTSCWRDDFVRVGGFDERMGWGGEDRELGERLENAGIRGEQIRYSAPLLHLDHTRPYIEPDRLSLNKRIRRETRKKKLTMSGAATTRTND